MKVIRGSEGAALVEALLLILVLFVPLVALLSGLARVHAAALGVTAAAREAGSAAVEAPDAAGAARLGRAAAASALNNQSLQPKDARLDLSGTASLDRGAAVEVRVAYPVRLFDIPLVSRGAGPILWVRASHRAHVDLYRSFP